MTNTTAQTVTVRPRRDSDLPALAAILERQQQATFYPVTWPLPDSVEEFLVRKSELAGWVAEVDGEVLGHVSLTAVNDDHEEADLGLGHLWSAAHSSAAGRPVQLDELRCISVFFADIRRTGAGIGSALYETAIAAALKDGFPVLDVVQVNTGAVKFYLKRGWVIIGEMTTQWDPSGPTLIHLMILSHDSARAGTCSSSGVETPSPLVKSACPT